MKKINIWVAVTLLLIVGAVSFMAGKTSNECYKEFYEQHSGNKDYLAACRMSDLIRHYEDDLNDSEQSIQDWGCFEELEELYLHDDMVGEPIDLREYVYCY